MSKLVAAGARAVTRCDLLGEGAFSDEPDMLFRAWLTPAFARTQAQVGAWMVEAGMTVRVDAATNLVGRYEGTDPDAPVLLIGSHIDSVRDAGRYDGPLGVMLGIECVAALAAAGRRLRFGIEVIAFGDEEGSRFPAAMLTSRAVAGTLEATALDVADRDGTTLAEALCEYRDFSALRDPATPRHPGERRGLREAGATMPHGETTAFAGAMVGGAAAGTGATTDEVARRESAPPATITATMLAAARLPGSVLAYLEAHIEQGPALEADDLPVGIVTGIAAQLRYRIVVEGWAGHAGTTAMNLRRDALAATAEIVLAVERIANAGPQDLVATVGQLRVAPGAPNVIPGHVEMSLDVRALDAVVRDAAAAGIVAEARRIGAARGVGAVPHRVHDLPASPCDPALVDLLAGAVAALGIPARRLASGAGHDAMAMAALCPTAMLFVRCRGGVSHNPAEHVEPADVQVALDAMLGFVDRLGALND